MSGAGVVVTTEWLEAHLDDPDLVVVEVDEKPLIHRLGHIPGAHNLDWRTDIQDPRTRDIPGPAAVRELWAKLGVTRSSTVVFYGDKSNWYASYGAWLFRLHGAKDVRVLDGGRQRWVVEDRPLSKAAAAPPGAAPLKPKLDPGLRIGWREIPAAVRHGAQLVDVRTTAEYIGAVISEPGYPEESAQRPGHIPSAIGMPWDVMLDPSGLLLPEPELLGQLAAHGIDPERELILYCRIGERSAHTWFVLNEVLGLEARNYDGSWIEWGSMVGMPIALGEDPGDAAELERLAD
ncbi:MAG TPA: sulfurtransferase [Solirubrobacterales bacterium]|jgi:thiosulfate/3-mercaptopyruvate sulfurtransferase